jgi:hypothetical protein
MDYGSSENKLDQRLSAIGKVPYMNSYTSYQNVILYVFVNPSYYL